MPRLKIQAFKESGKYYAESSHELNDFPHFHSFPNEQSIGYIRNAQSNYTYDLWEKIRDGQLENLSPISNGFKGYYFVFNIIFDSHDQHGFMTFLLNRIEK